jgi:hypothetical protein
MTQASDAPNPRPSRRDRQRFNANSGVPQGLGFVTWVVDRGERDLPTLFFQLQRKFSG